MEGVAAAFGDGVDLAPGGLAELGAVGGGVDLKLLDGVEAVDVGHAGGAAAGFREEGLVVVGAVDVVAVVKAGDAVVADQTAGAIGGGVGGEEGEIAPVAGGDGEVGDHVLGELFGGFGLLGVENGIFTGDDDPGRDARGRHGRVDGEGLADAEEEVGFLDGGESGG